MKKIIREEKERKKRRPGQAACLLLALSVLCFIVAGCLSPEQAGSGTESRPDREESTESTESTAQGEEGRAGKGDWEAWQASYEAGSALPEITDSSRLWRADLTHDGQEEQLVFDWGFYEESGFCIFAVLGGENRVLYSTELSQSHAGWDNLYLCRWNGQDYLLRYGPECYSAVYDHSYVLFWLDESGQELREDSGGISFYAGGDASEQENMPAVDISAMAALADTVNTYMENSFLLAGTNEMAFGSSDLDTGQGFVTSTPENPIRLWETYGTEAADIYGSKKPQLLTLAEKVKAWCESEGIPYVE